MNHTRTRCQQSAREREGDRDMNKDRERNRYRQTGRERQIPQRCPLILAQREHSCCLVKSQTRYLPNISKICKTVANYSKRTTYAQRIGQQYKSHRISLRCAPRKTHILRERAIAVASSSKANPKQLCMLCMHQLCSKVQQ